ncbi:hypothetical protein G3I15_53210, partial [Streptomyces sp. SID10244]|nr:hypothetical protein [Streptomyces sp. SID10244]
RAGRVIVYGIAAALVVSLGTAVGEGTSVALPSNGSAGASACSRTAAQTQGWGGAAQTDDFATAASLNNWHRYEGVGHDGNGTRSPDAVSVADGSMVIQADISGRSGGVTPRWG